MKKSHKYAIYGATGIGLTAFAVYLLTGAKAYAPPPPPPKEPPPVIPPIDPSQIPPPTGDREVDYVAGLTSGDCIPWSGSKITGGAKIHCTYYYGVGENIKKSGCYNDYYQGVVDSGAEVCEKPPPECPPGYSWDDTKGGCFADRSLIDEAYNHGFDWGRAGEVMDKCLAYHHDADLHNSCKTGWVAGFVPSEEEARYRQAWIYGYDLGYYGGNQGECYFIYGSGEAYWKCTDGHRQGEFDRAQSHPYNSTPPWIQV